jgi:hypothetical protein
MSRLRFDIFRTLYDGHPLWMAEVATLEQAKTNLHALALKSRSEYFIQEASTGEIVFQFVSPDESSLRYSRSACRTKNFLSRIL